MGLTITVKQKVKSEISSTGNNLKIEIVDNAKIYGEKNSLWENIQIVLMETNMKENLSRQHKEAFDRCKRRRQVINPDNVFKLYS